jgi:hypothetical protein
MELDLPTRVFHSPHMHICVAYQPPKYICKDKKISPRENLTNSIFGNIAKFEKIPNLAYSASTDSCYDYIGFFK